MILGQMPRLHGMIARSYLVIARNLLREAGGGE
jgi:hypothetical protein